MIEKTVWFGQHKGINFEINRFGSFDKGSFDASWTFYLHLAAEQFPEHDREKVMPKIYFTQFGTPINSYKGPIEDLDWHGGLTWSSNETKEDSVFTCLKFGCDYQHLWDSNKVYDLNLVKQEAEVCIDSLFKRWPELKTIENLWDEHRKKFPGEKAGDDRFFDKHGNKIDYPFCD